MENASKALLIAGGVLIAVLIMGLLMYLWLSMGNLTSESEKKKAQEQLTAFNKQYESYQRQLLRGNDIASVINKVRDNNLRYADNPDYQITWRFKLINRNSPSGMPAGTYTEDNSSIYNNMRENEEDFRRFKGLYFRCTKLEYSRKTGRVNLIEFEELLENDVFGDWFAFSLQNRRQEAKTWKMLQKL